MGQVAHDFPAPTMVRARWQMSPCGQGRMTDSRLWAARSCSLLNGWVDTLERVGLVKLATSRGEEGPPPFLPRLS